MFPDRARARGADGGGGAVAAAQGDARTSGGIFEITSRARGASQSIIIISESREETAVRNVRRTRDEDEEAAVDGRGESEREREEREEREKD